MNLDHKFNSIRERMALSASEKAEHRAALLTSMRAKNVPVKSPYTWTVFFDMRYAVATLLLLLVSGSGVGVVVASENAQPGSPLYGVKLTVAEPTRIALARDRGERAELEVAYTERRLKEFTAATVSNTIDAKTTELIAASLEDRLDGAEKDIDEMNASGEGGDAYSARTELRSVLTAHARILKKIVAADPDDEVAVAMIAAHIEENLADASAAGDEFVAALDDQASRGVLTEAVEESQGEVIQVLEDLRQDMIEAGDTLDAEDHLILTESITAVTETLESATREKDDGHSREALKLYIDADSRIGELQTLIEAERTLGIDLIDRE